MAKEKRVEKCNKKFATVFTFFRQEVLKSDQKWYHQIKSPLFEKPTLREKLIICDKNISLQQGVALSVLKGPVNVKNYQIYSININLEVH